MKRLSHSRTRPPHIMAPPTTSRPIDDMEAAGQLRPSVLVIDDNHDAADSLALLLRVWGFDVRVTYSGKEGLEVARSYQPDCVLSDIGLPEMDGYHLADE